MENETIRSRLRLTEVRKQDDGLQLVHHGTAGSFAVEEMSPFSHFGTRTAAKARLTGIGGAMPEEARLISGFLDIRNPLYLPDLNDGHDAWNIAELMAAVEPDLFSSLPNVVGEADQPWETLRAACRAAGFDGFGYRNLHEDPGSMSWMILDPSQVIVLRDGPAAGSRDPWELSHEEYTGPNMVLDVFGIDGRCGYYDHLWEEMDVAGEDLPVLARNPEGWTARWLEGFDPEATLGLFNPAGEPQGFYMGGQIWIDPQARGQGRSALMINAAADLLGDCPAQNDQGMGFSPAGQAAHEAAWRVMQDWALREGYIDDPADGFGPAMD